MTKVKFGVGTYSYGYVNGKRYFVENTAEQIAAFIMKYRYDDKVIVSLFDELEIKIMGEFIDFCQNQYFLQEALLPVLVPMQQGSLEIPEFVPYRDDNWKVKNVRVLAQTGEFFLADLEYIDRECNVIRISENFKNVANLITEYPKSISVEQAVNIAIERELI